MTSYVIIGILVIIILAIYYSQRERKEQLDKEYDADLLRLHPTIGFQGRWLAWLRALTQSILQSKRWSIKGHFKVSFTECFTSHSSRLKRGIVGSILKPAYHSSSRVSNGG